MYKKLPVATDNCDPDVTNIVKTAGAFVAGACPQAGTYTNTWTVTDDRALINTFHTQLSTISGTPAPACTTTAGALDITLE